MNEEQQAEEDPPDCPDQGLNYIKRLQYYFGGLNAVNWTLCLGAPLILLAVEWGANPLQIGILASFVYIFSPIQVIANVFLGRVGCKRLMLSGWSTRNLFILPVPLMVIFGGMEPAAWKVYTLIFCLGCFGLMRSIGLTAQMPWIYGLIPQDHRGKFFSNYMIVVNMTGAGMFLISAIMFYLFSSQSSFALVFSLALLSGFVAASVLARLPDVEKPESLSLPEIGRLSMQFARTPSVFRRSTGFWITYYAFVSPLVPFLIYYVSKEGILASDQVMLMALLNFSGGIMGSWISRSWLDLLGIRFFASICLGGLAGTMVVLGGLIAATHVNGEPIPGMAIAIIATIFVVGIFSSALYTISMKMQPYVTQERTRALQVSLFYATGTLCAGLSSLLWGGLLRIPMPTGGEVNIYLLLGYVGLSCLVFMINSVMMVRLPIQEAVPRPMNFFARIFNRKNFPS